MSNTFLRMAAAALLTLCGFCVGDIRRQNRSSRRRILEEIVGLLMRLRQEIACRRTDLNCLYQILASEYPLGGPLKKSFCVGTSFQNLQPPMLLEQEQAACFVECFSGLGRTDARQECARLDYYLQRFDVFLTRARQDEQLSLSLDRRLGLAAGALLGLLVM